MSGQSTELEVAAPAGLVAFEERPQTALELWAGDLTQSYQIARQLVTTAFVPESYKGKPEQAAAAIMAGGELGLSPLAALRSIDIINGVPGMRAIALRALVQSHGHEIWTDESTAERAIVKGRRKGSDTVETSIWTLDRARGLQLLSKDNWRKQPIPMLLARATSELARLIAADVLLGIPYSIEELEDLGKAEVAPAAPPVKKPASRTVKRAALDPKRGEAPEPDGADELTGAAAAASRGAAKQEPEAPVDGDAEDAERMAEIAREAEEEEQRLADEARNEEVKRAAAAAFEAPPLDLTEPEIDWDTPR